VVPRIDEPFAGEPSAKLWSEAKGAETEFRRLKEQLPMLRIELLHGRMESAEKERVIEAVQAGHVDVLVSTQVIEVGIDLPAATVMVIEGGELFGLSALHQLRGRVGRSERKSYCFVFAQAGNELAGERLKTFVRTQDGFEIAEADFRLRGPGQFFGTAQSGLAELRVADLLRDEELLTQARGAAREIVAGDPDLQRPEYAALRRRVEAVLGRRLELVDVG
jgi:ATP-dependent DNA helicase RecG